MTTLWTDGQRYYPLHVRPYTLAARLAQGKADPAFLSKPQIALSLIKQAQTAGIAFRVVVADCFYGDHAELVRTLNQARLPYVLAHRGGVGRGWAPEDQAHSFEEAIKALPNAAWQPMTCRFRDGHTSLWWAAELTFLHYGPDKAIRAICATTDRQKLPGPSTWYLTTHLPTAQASLADVVRWYGLRNWVEEGYKRMKDELGWADFMVRSDRAIRAWLAPAFWLSRCWPAFSSQAPPRAFAAILDAVIAGRGLNLYLRI